jgi:hypothetical protein
MSYSRIEAVSVAGNTKTLLHAIDLHRQLTDRPHIDG